MIIKLKQDLSKKDIEVLITYPEMNKTVQNLHKTIESFNQAIKCFDEDKNVLVKISNIFYIESVDKRVFVYTKNLVFRCELPLYKLGEILSQFGFVQVAKSCILNLNELASVKSILNSRMEATLTNGEKLNISRKYLPHLKHKLEEII